MLFAVLAAPVSAHAQVSLPNIRPVPQHVEWGQGVPGQMNIGSIVSISVSPSAGSMQAGIDHILERLSEIGRAAIPVAATPQAPGQPGTLWLGLDSDRDWSRDLWLTSPGKPEGYRLVVNADSIIIVGEDESGLYYGLTTLRQMIGADGSVAKLAIQDWPALPFRGVHYIHVNPPEEQVRPLSLLKANAIAAENPEFYDLANEGIRQRWQNAMALCRANRMELIPELQSLGWGFAVLARDPRTAEGTPVRFLFRVQGGTLVFTAYLDSTGAPPLKNAIITEAAPLRVKSADGARTYVEGVDYELVPGSPLTYPPTDGTPMTIRTLPGGSIQEGQDLQVSYTYMPQDAMSCCPSEPLYHDLMRNAITRVITDLQPKYLHIGHDEPRVMARDERCKSRGLTNAELFAEDVTRMHDYAAAVDPDVRLMMWNDAINPLQNAPLLGLSDVRFMIPKDIVMCAWYYGYPYENQRIQDSVPLFTGAGFDVTGSAWYDPRNAEFWGQYMVNLRATTDRSLGLLCTTWPDFPAHDSFGGINTTLEWGWSGGRTAVALGTPLDTDRDGLSNVTETVDDYDLDGAPNYADTDSDNDGVSDTHEVLFGTNPLNALDWPELPMGGLGALGLLAGILGFAGVRLAVRHSNRTKP